MCSESRQVVDRVWACSAFTRHITGVGIFARPYTKRNGGQRASATCLDCPIELFACVYAVPFLYLTAAYFLVCM
uniref:Keratinocyte proline-rich protein n=1 Tax=Mesocestoides corti TaxID=53468 RepID=A0A5K3EFF6_MESCO